MATSLMVCVHNCGPRFDTSLHCMECVANPALQTLRLLLSHTLCQNGVHREMALRLGHHPSCVKEFLRGQIPLLWVRATFSFVFPETQGGNEFEIIMLFRLRVPAVDRTRICDFGRRSATEAATDLQQIP